MLQIRTIWKIMLQIRTIWKIVVQRTQFHTHNLEDYATLKDWVLYFTRSQQSLHRIGNHQHMSGCNVRRALTTSRRDGSI